jgi:hypothetical protein
MYCGRSKCSGGHKNVRMWGRVLCDGKGSNIEDEIIHIFKTLMKMRKNWVNNGFISLPPRHFLSHTE